MKNQGYSLLSIYKGYQSVSLYIYYACLALVIIGLFFSRVLVSSGFLLFIINWILEGDYQNKWKELKENKEKMIISLIFIIHLIGMINTSDLPYGLSELKIKLPLVLPVFFFSIPKNRFKKDGLIILFIISAVISSIYGLLIFETKTDFSSFEDLHQIAICGENIELSVFINFAICCILYLVFLKSEKKKPVFKIILITILIWLIVFLYLINSYTGFIIFPVIIIYSILSIIKKKSRLFFLISVCIFILSTLWLSVYIIRLTKIYMYTEPVNFSKLEQKTVNGNPYLNDTLSIRSENGHLTDIYICYKELKKEWEKKSSIPFSENDRKGQYLAETLIRYLSSKGLKKDSVGFSHLSGNDIAYIEYGCTNYLYTNKYSLKSRVYNILWQLKTYKTTGNSTAQSISQRIVFLKASVILIKQNFWFGVGTGDVMNSFRIVLEQMKTGLSPDYYNRVHNQFIVEIAALGIFGFIAFILIIFFPVFRFKIWNNYLFSCFYIIILLSYLTDNPLETQLGVSFFITLYCIFVGNEKDSCLYLFKEKNNYVELR